MMDERTYQTWFARLYQFMRAAVLFVKRHRLVQFHSVKPEERLRTLLEPFLDSVGKATTLVNKKFPLQVGVMLEETLE